MISLSSRGYHCFLIRDTLLCGMYKVVVVGDAACGKTTLLLSATRGAFPEVIDTNTMQYSSKVKVDGKSAELELYDTYGTDESQRQRVALYPGSDVFVLCYSIISPYSFDNIRSKVHPCCQFTHFLVVNRSLQIL